MKFVRFSSIKWVFPLILLVSFSIYLVLVNIVIVHTLVPKRGSVISKVVESGNALFVYNATRLDHAHLFYRALLVKHWINDPETVLFFDASIVNYSAPWYVRGYSIGVSNISIRIEGLPDYVNWYWSYHEGVSRGGNWTSYTLMVWIYVEGYIAKRYNATLHILLKLRVVEWSFLGPIRSYEITVLNKTVPITINVKYVWLYGCPHLK